MMGIAGAALMLTLASGGHRGGGAAAESIPEPAVTGTVQEAARIRHISLDEGRIYGHFDLTNQDMHIDAAPGYSPDAMASLLDRLEDVGLEVLLPDECPPITLDNGMVRRYVVFSNGKGLNHA